MAKLETIADLWQELAERIFAGTQVQPGKPQYEDMRKAFYSGAFCMFTCVTRVGELTEDDGSDYLADLQTELLEFLPTLDSNTHEGN